MAVDFDLICRRDSLGSLLAAAILARAGCRVLLLPPRAEVRPEPEFLVPVARGYPAAVLSGLVKSEALPQNLLSWRDSAGSLRQWPGFSASEAPGEEAWLELEKLWRLIDNCMRRQLEMPVASLTGTGRMLWLLVRDELLRENRTRRLNDWLVSAGIDGAGRDFWRCLIPLLTLSRFADPPLLAFAYGAAVLARPEGWFPVVGLKAQLLAILRSHGADFSGEVEWGPVFDGKWYIGVGRDRQAQRRSTVYLADSDPEVLRREVDSADQRLDFKRQIELAEPGFVVYEEGKDETLPEKDALYHLECGSGHDFTGSLLVGPGLGESGRRVGYRFRPAGGPDQGDNPAAGERTWGWSPRLPAMMGGGFLPLTKGFCRFYQVGWHNLPGFGLGGLVYAARQAAVKIWTNDLRRDPAGLDGGSGR